MYKNCTGHRFTIKIQTMYTMKLVADNINDVLVIKIES